MKHSFNALMQEFPMVAILRGIKPDEVIEHAQVLIAAGFRLLEVPLNSPDAFTSIRSLQDKFGEQVLIGAGTVLTMTQLTELVATGAKLMVCPHTDVELIKAAKVAGLYAMPGFFTASEAFAALHAGADAVKLFPAEALPTINVVKALGAVIPAETWLCPVGGVTPNNVADYLNVGARGFGLGSALYKKGQSVEMTKANAEAFMAAWKAYQK
ncbi:MAG: 2-dehydro-3-deoxy-6-phosphogalactonate aldolase [Gammaproteobacteria bacterium]|uniref:2-dehydro-3-deoxy-6-phosphogalactonate aldolase n=1 Tax=Marinomonas TaxID=28253 RepID=UPI000C1F88D0|nr:2-dehydro-3-deoxy-6-phosphogalactonate aldolase [Marinomonas sp. BSi20584]MBU1294590.1 2-dehydro-3-deoxy-6-phosphogalactonate aldolase [Gammaproteobacteria bacterium]MBU1465402.1 2-dehydro-3-deoxy-6-phosphogalactonate aldolase [Gammaproteobacteria bacterium]MBU2023961.1 2-dehydro-3-deoxy-6-phosphogalactonate aldolase [Gammaproteobacteria bacterium]MBU2240470.1 2-dehydro-3-deoxy-6-phosphogalactonate aldolase [Gammaproteobacteria bacterium]MBU2414058.1 2-dehydro-3-deoxy-6-phosphogalactonate a